MSIRETNCAIQWIDLSAVDCVIHFLNNRGMILKIGISNKCISKCYFINHNHNKMLKSDWLSTVLISARTVRAIAARIYWLFSLLTKTLGISCVLI